MLRPGGRLGVVGTTPDPEVGWVGAMFGGGVEEHRATHSYYLVADDRARARLDDVVRRGAAEQFPGAERIDLPLRTWCWRVERV